VMAPLADEAAREIFERGEEERPKGKRRLYHGAPTCIRP
jgi:hypothetical protein